jgi:parallel beta-helix repeat protein
VVGAGPTALTTQQGITIQDGASGKIRENTVQDLEFTGDPSVVAVGIFLWDSAEGIKIADNTLEDTETGILVQGVEGVKISENEITDSPGGAVVNRGIWLLGRGSGSTGCVGGDGVTPGKGCATAAKINKNTITGNGVGSGVVIGKPPEVAFTPAPSTGKLRDNDISGWATSVLVLPTGSLE